jgi:hypothetical protein
MGPGEAAPIVNPRVVPAKKSLDREGLSSRVFTAVIEGVPISSESALHHLCKSGMFRG